MVFRVPKDNDGIFSSFKGRRAFNTSRLYLAGSALVLGLVVYRGIRIRTMKESGELEKNDWDDMTTSTKYISLSNYGMDWTGKVDPDKPVTVVMGKGLSHFERFDVKRSDLNIKSAKQLYSDKKETERKAEEDAD